MRFPLFVAITVLVLQALAMPASAQQTSSGARNNCQSFVVVNVASAIAAGTVTSCLTVPSEVSSESASFFVGASIFGPVITGLVVTTPLIAVTGVSGCTGSAGAPIVHNGLFGTSVTAGITMTMTSRDCSGFVLFHLANTVFGGFYDDQMAFSVTSLDGVRSEVYGIGCSATLAVPQAFNEATTVCNTPALLNFGCGAQGYSVNTQPNTAPCALPVVNNLNYGCAATGGTPSAFNAGTTICSTPTYTVVNSGTQHLVVDSWPSLTAAVANSGTVNVVNSGGQSMTVSGSLTVAGGLTVTNAGGQSLTVTSWPQLQAVLSGALTVHQDPICTAAAHCHDDLSGFTVNNTVGAVMIPSTFHMCGPPVASNASACSPVASSVAASMPSGGAPDMLALAWIVVLLWMFRLGKLLAGSMAAVGAVVAFLAANVFLVAGVVALFVAAIFLEAFARERIYSRFLNPKKVD